MPRLRLLKARTEETLSHPQGGADLRGLGDPGLFHDSGFVAQLVVAGAPPIEELRAWCEAWSLQLQAHPSADRTLVAQTRWRQPGEHKKQALTLFFAAMELRHRVPGSRCLLIQHNGLRSALGSRINGFHHHGEDARQVVDWLGESHAFTLDGATTHHLAQAGLPIAASHEHAHLDEKALADIHRHLTAASAGSPASATEAPAAKAARRAAS